METIVTVSNFEKCLMKKLATAYKNSKLCDMTITCSDGDIEAHSLVVGAYIPVFKKQQFDEVIVHRSKFSKECMECILDIIYFGTKNIPTSLVDELTEALEWYGIEGLEIKMLKLTPTNPEGIVIRQANSTMIKEEFDDRYISENDDDKENKDGIFLGPVDSKLFKEESDDITILENGVKATRMELDCVKKEDPDRSEFEESCSSKIVPRHNRELKRPTCDSSDEEQYAKAPKIEPLDCIKKEDPDRSQFEEPYSSNIGSQDIRALKRPTCESSDEEQHTKAARMELDCVKKEDPDRSEFEEPCLSDIVPRDNRALEIAALDCVKKEDPDRSQFEEPCSSNISPQDIGAAEMALDCLKNEDADRSEFEEPCSSNIVPQDNRDCKKTSSSSSDCDGDSISDAPSKSIFKLISTMSRKAALHVCVVCMEECTNIVEHRKMHQNKSRKKEICNCGKKFFIESFITHHKCK